MLEKNEKKERFAELIKAIRKDKGLTIDEVAERGGVGKSTVSQLENGKKDIPKFSTIQKIAKGLHTDEKQLVEAAGYIYDSDTLKNSDDLTDTQKKVAYLVSPDADEEDYKRIKQLFDAALINKIDY